MAEYILHYEDLLMGDDSVKRVRLEQAEEAIKSGDIVLLKLDGEIIDKIATVLELNERFPAP